MYKHIVRPIVLDRKLNVWTTKGLYNNIFIFLLSLLATILRCVKKRGSWIFSTGGEGNEDLFSHVRICVSSAIQLHTYRLKAYAGGNVVMDSADCGDSRWFLSVGNVIIIIVLFSFI